MWIDVSQEMEVEFGSDILDRMDSAKLEFQSLYPQTFLESYVTRLSSAVGKVKIPIDRDSQVTEEFLLQHGDLRTLCSSENE